MSDLIKTTYEVKLRHMLARLLSVKQLFFKVLKSGHRLTLAGRALNKVANESWKVPLINSMMNKDMPELHQRQNRLVGFSSAFTE